MHMHKSKTKIILQSLYLPQPHTEVKEALNPGFCLEKGHGRRRLHLSFGDLEVGKTRRELNDGQHQIRYKSLSCGTKKVCNAVLSKVKHDVATCFLCGCNHLIMCRQTA